MRDPDFIYTPELTAMLGYSSSASITYLVRRRVLPEGEAVLENGKLHKRWRRSLLRELLAGAKKPFDLRLAGIDGRMTSALEKLDEGRSACADRASAHSASPSGPGEAPGAEERSIRLSRPKA